MNRVVVSLIVTIVLAAATLPAVKAQDSSRDAERERLRRIMDPATDVEEFRRELDSFYADLQTSVNTVLESEFARDLMARNGLDLLGQLADVRKKIPQLTPQDLGLLKTAFATNLNWREMPDRINSLFNPGTREALKRMRAPKARGPVFSIEAAVMPSPVHILPGGGIHDNCDNAFFDANHQNPRISNSDISVSAGVEIGTAAAAAGIPTELEPASAIAVAADAAAKVALLVLQTLKSISDDCQGQDFQNYVTSNLDEQVSTRASQTSVDNLQTSANSVQTTLNNVQTTVNNVQTTVNNVQTTVNNVQTTLNNVQTTVNNVQTTSNTILGKVTVIDTKVDTANGKLDQLLTNLAAFQAQSLRLQIEANMSDGTNSAAIGLFELPAAQGGFLDLARSILVETIQKIQATGQSVGSALMFLNRGDQQKAAGQFKDAYDSYRQAYRTATGH